MVFLGRFSPLCRVGSTQNEYLWWLCFGLAVKILPHPHRSALKLDPLRAVEKVSSEISQTGCVSSCVSYGMYAAHQSALLSYIFQGFSRYGMVRCGAVRCGVCAVRIFFFRIPRCSSVRFFPRESYTVRCPVR